MSEAENQLFVTAHLKQTIKEKENDTKDPCNKSQRMIDRLEWLNVVVIYHANDYDKIEIYVANRGEDAQNVEHNKTAIYSIIYKLQKYYTTYMIQTIQIYT